MKREPAGLASVLILCAVGAGLGLLPPAASGRWRNAVRDALRPGQELALAAAQAARGHAVGRLPPSSSSAADRDPRDRLEALERAHQRLTALWIGREGSSGTEPHLPARASTSAPLLVPEWLEARILGEVSAGLWRSHQVLGAGTAAGIAESATVLEGEQPLLDLGTDHDVAAGDAVYAGQTVIGKVAVAGRFTSTLLRVTDAGYSGRAQVARRTARGPAPGPEGTLTGDGGPVCRLRHVTEPVSVGDEVYTGGTDGLLPAPQYYGRVVRAELEPGATEWSIDVLPPAGVERGGQVRILRLTLNPQRVLAN